MNYFGTDGIRGIPNQKLTIELAVKVGQALSVFHNQFVCIATDTRMSKDMLVAGIAGGAMSKGISVVNLGVLSTPALIYYSKVHQMTGVMITASHNPYEDNGIKILNRGQKLSLEEEGMLDIEIDRTKEATPDIGLMKFEDGKEIYYQHILSLFKPTHFKVALDCANGATFEIAPKVLKELSSKLIVVAAEPNGININEQCGSTHLDLLKHTVINNHCDIGFAMDGDGDRVLCVQSDGYIVTGDELIYVIACYLKENNLLYQNKVVVSKMTNMGVLLAFRKKGIEVIQTEVGDKYISLALKEQEASIGGENSGHIILPQFCSSGDGILIAGYLLNLLEETNTTIQDWLKDLRLYPEKTVNLKVHHKEHIITNKMLKEQVEEIKQSLGSSAKVIVRASGTEDCIRVTVMAPQESQVQHSLSLLTSIIQEMDYE